MWEKYDLLFSRRIECSPSVSSDTNNVTGMNDIVKLCAVKINANNK